jgi:hypothetical protein
VFFERPKTARVLGMSEEELGKIIRYTFYLSIPVSYNQLLPASYANGLAAYLKENRRVTRAAATRGFACLSSTQELMERVQTTFDKALRSREIYSAKELVNLLSVPEERVRHWVELGKIYPIVSPKPGGSGVLRFTRPHIESTLAWHFPEL